MTEQPDGRTADPDSPMPPPRPRTVSIEAAAIAGVASSILSIIGLVLLSRFPDLDEGDAAISTWFDDTGNRATLITGLNLVVVSSVAFLWLVAVIRRRLGDRENRFFATAFFGSAVVFLATWLVGAGLLASPAVAMTLLDAGAVSPASASLAAGAGGSFLLVVAPRFQAVFVLATANLFRQSDAAPRWLTLVSTITGAVLFLVPLVTTPIGLLFPTWVFLVGVTLLVTKPNIAPIPGASTGPDR
jgi:hypothetical protein